MYSTKQFHQKQPFDPEEFQRATDLALAAHARRVRAEVDLLGAICPIGRRGLALARAEGITPTDWTQDDTIAIFAALQVAESDGRIADREQTYLLARHALILAEQWDESDTRSFVGGMIRGPGPLAHLFCGVSPADANRLTPIRSRELVALRDGRVAA